MNGVVQDVRLGLRKLAERPRFTVATVLTLALGVGANTTIFSLVNGILLPPLPYPNSARLVTLDNGYMPPGAYTGLKDLDHAVRLAGYVASRGFNLRQGSQTIRLNGSSVSANFFSVLGVSPFRGRTFVEGEDNPGQDKVAVLSYGLWRHEFAADPNIVGRSIQLDGSSHEIVGVMPASFHFPSPATAIWLPLPLDPGAMNDYWMVYNVQVAGRLAPGSSLATARAELGTILPRVRAMFPYPTDKDWGSYFPLVPLRDSLVEDVRTRLLVMLGVAGLVLVIACVTVANLMLVRAVEREREFAVRFALGASRGRVARQLILETMPLALVGGGLAFLLAKSGVPLVLHVLPGSSPRLGSVSMDFRVFAFAMALACLAGLICGLVPGLRTSEGKLDQRLRSAAIAAGATQERQRLSAVLMVGEVAVAVVVVIGTGLLLRSLWKLTHVNPGFMARQLIAARIAPDPEFCKVPERCVNFYKDVLRHVASSPGVESAGTVNNFPLMGDVKIGPILPEGYSLATAKAIPLVWEDIIDPGFLRTMGIPLVAGRNLSEADAENARQVCLISRSLAERYWPGQNPVGKHLSSLGAAAYTSWTIVGLVGEVREFSLEGDFQFYRGEVYFPFAQAVADQSLISGPAMWLVVRSRVSLSRMGPNLRQSVRQVNPSIPVAKEETIDDIMAESAAGARSSAWLCLMFAALAVVLSGAGLYSVIAFLVSRRTREIGIRMALGARPGRVFRQILWQGARLALTGVVVGLAGAFGLMRLLGSLLYGVGVGDPGTYLAASVFLMLVALAACSSPARHAMCTDPASALRCE